MKAVEGQGKRVVRMTERIIVFIILSRRSGDWSDEKDMRIKRIPKDIFYFRIYLDLIIYLCFQTSEGKTEMGG